MGSGGRGESCACSDPLTLTRTRNRETSRPKYVMMAVPNSMAQAIWPPERPLASMVVVVVVGAAAASSGRSVGQRGGPDGRVQEATSTPRH